MKTRFSVSPDEALAKCLPNVPGFRDRQRDAVQRVWDGRSSLVLMPTGTGKSLVYQLPVLASGGVGVVVSPLIALMQQQARTLQEQGARVLSLGGADAREAQESLRKFPWAGGPGFIFVSPERAETDGYLEHVLRRHRDDVALVAVDEAHCISQWGHDFRPEYKAIPGFLDRVFGRGSWPSVLCLTATLDAHNQAEVLADFRLKTEDVVRSPNMLRTNLDLSFRVFGNRDEKLKGLEELLEAHRGQKVIVYTHLKQNKTQGTKALAERFRQRGFRCAHFDADLPLAQKDETLLKFASGETDLVFATGAFGMGVDIPDIRGVIHFLLPESLEQYYQEVGRAGRDGKPGFGVLLHTAINAKVRRDLIRQGRRTEEQVREVWDNVCNAGRGLQTINPWVQFQGRDEEHALFYAFQRAGALTVVARGPGRLRPFEARDGEGAAFLNRLAAATRTGSTAAAIRALGIDPDKTVNELFDLYHRGSVKLTLSPDKTQFFQAGELRDADVKAIVADIDAKVQKRLAGFDAFVELVEAGVDPSEELRSRFGDI